MNSIPPFGHGGLLNINEASVEELMTLPGIGRSTTGDGSLGSP